MASIDRDYILQTISDLSKDAYGFRVRLDYASMSDAELAETFDRYLDRPRTDRSSDQPGQLGKTHRRLDGGWRRRPGYRDPLGHACQQSWSPRRGFLLPPRRHRLFKRGEDQRHLEPPLTKSL
jgi:hypothetical protein